MAFKKILVPLDGSILAEHAIGTAAELAAGGATVMLVRAAEAHGLPGVDPTDMQVDVVREAEEYLGARRGSTRAGRNQERADERVVRTAGVGHRRGGAAARSRPHRHEHPRPERARPPHPGERGRGGAAQHDDADPARARVRGAAGGDPRYGRVAGQRRCISGPSSRSTARRSRRRSCHSSGRSPARSTWRCSCCASWRRRRWRRSKRRHVSSSASWDEREDAEEYLARLAEDLRNRGVRVDTRVNRGEAAHEILARRAGDRGRPDRDVYP